MKRRSATILVMLSAALFTMTTSAYAAESENPFLGTWDIDLQQSQFGSATPPVSMSRTYADLGDGNYMYLVVSTDEEGALSGSSASYSYSGEQYPIASLDQLEAPRISYRRINDATVEYTVRLGGEIQSIGAKFISPNYSKLQIAIQYPNSDQEDQILVFNKRNN